MRRGIGLLGGSFDPVHNGHLAVARGAYDALLLQRVDFVLAPRPWQKSIATPVGVRLEMLEAAIEGQEGFGVNKLEIERTGNTYTIDTLRQMRELVGEAMPLVLILGEDQWANLHTWKDWDKLTDFAHLALCNRAQTEARACAPEVLDWARERFTPALRLTAAAAGGIARFEIPAHEASSTKIRSILAEMPREEALKRLEKWLPFGTACVISRRKAY